MTTSLLTPPAPNELRELREALGIKPEQCANLLHVNKRTWQRWERGATPMPYAYWELFAIKCELLRTGVLNV